MRALRCFLLVLLLALSSAAHAAVDGWTGAAGDGLWSNHANWSTGAVPGAGDTARFDGATSNAPCTIDAAATVSAIQVAAAYTGTITQSRSLTITGSLAISGGLWQCGSSNLSVGGSIAIANQAGLFTAGSSTITLTGAGTLASPANAFASLTIGGGASITLTGDIIVTTLCTLATGSSLSMQGGSTLHLRGTGTLLQLSGSLAAVAPLGGVVAYESTGPQPMDVAGGSYGSCQIQLVSMTAGPTTFSQKGDLTGVDSFITDGTVVGGANITWRLNNHALTCAHGIAIGDGGGSLCGTTIAAGNGTVTAGGEASFSSPQDSLQLVNSQWTVAAWNIASASAAVAPGKSQVTITTGPIGAAGSAVPQAFGTLVVAPAPGVTVAALSPLSVLGSLAVSAGTLDATAVTCDGSVSVASVAAVNAGALTLGGAGSQSCQLSAASSIGALAIGGGARKVALGGCALGSWTIGAGATVAVTAGQTVSVAGGLDALGTAASPITLRSSANGLPWFLTLAPAAFQQIAYVMAQDSDAAHGEYINDSASGTDLGGNTSWFFPGQLATPSFTLPTAPVSSLENAGAQSIAGVASGINAGGQGLSVAFQVSDTNGSAALFSVPPAISPTGTLSFTPAPNAFGTATVSVVATNGVPNVPSSAAQLLTIQILFVNQPPVFTLQAGPVSVPDTAGPQTIPGFATLLSPGAPGDPGVTVSFQVTTNGPAPNPLFAVQPTISPTGTLSFTPAGIAGSALLTVVAVNSAGTANGGSDTAAAQTATIQLTSAIPNQPPSFTIPTPLVDALTPGPSQTATPQSIPNYISSIQTGEADPTATVTFTVVFGVSTVADPSTLFTPTAQPAISPSGTLSFTSSGVAGSVTLLISATNSAGLTNPVPQKGAIILAPEFPPSFTFNGGPVYALSDAGQVTLNGWVSNITPGWPNPSGPVIIQTGIASTSNPNLFTQAPILDATGDLIIAIAPGQTGTATLTVQATQVVNNTQQASATQSAPITVFAPPIITMGPDETVPVDSGPADYPAWATIVTAGAPRGTLVSFTVIPNDAISQSLFSAPPILSSAGEFAFTPAAGAVGVANLSIVAQVTVNGQPVLGPALGFQTSVIIAPTPPSFAIGPDQLWLAGSGDHQISPWITGIAPSAPGGVVSFSAVPSNSSLFAQAPTVDASGALNAVLLPNQVGSSTLTIQAEETVDGVVAASAPQTATITVYVPPSFTVGPNETTAALIGQPQFYPGWATGIAAGAPSTSGVSFTVAFADPTQASLFSSAPAIDPNGDLSFQPSGTGTGTVTLSISAQDAVAGQIVSSAAQQATITIIAGAAQPPSFAMGGTSAFFPANAPNAATQPAFKNWITNVVPAAPGGSPVTMQVTVDAAEQGLFSPQPFLDAANNLYLPVTGSTGTCTLSFQAESTSGGTPMSSTQVATFTIYSQPSFTVAGAVSVPENSGRFSQAGWANHIALGQPSGGPLSFAVSCDNPALFSVAPAIDPTGALTFTPATGAAGQADLTIFAQNLVNGQLIQSNPMGATISVTLPGPSGGVPAAPSFLIGPGGSFAENSGTNTVATWITGIAPPGAGVSFLVTASNPSLFAQPPTVDAAGDLIAVVAPNQVGLTTLTVQAQEVIQGALVSSAVQSATFVVCVLPSFVAGPNETVSPPNGLTPPPDFPAWATNIMPGGPAGTAVSFVVTNPTPGFFAIAPVIRPTGELTFTLAPFVTPGSVGSFTVVAQDLVFGQVVQSPPVTVTITISSGLFGLSSSG